MLPLSLVGADSWADDISESRVMPAVATAVDWMNFRREMFMVKTQESCCKYRRTISCETVERAGRDGNFCVNGEFAIYDMRNRGFAGQPDDLGAKFVRK
jgi:hypothetical protein